MLILICRLFQIFIFSFCLSYITHMDIFHQSFPRNYLIYDYEIFLTICLFSESVTTSDGYRRGYMSFAHFLLYFVHHPYRRKLLGNENLLLSSCFCFLLLLLYWYMLALNNEDYHQWSARREKVVEVMKKDELE